jgi:ElaB/YqjD/DUF883 family membrane-anchored ribosome-binding protein
MEPIMQNQSQPLKQALASTATAAARAVSCDAQEVVDKVSEAANAVRDHLEERGAEFVSQAKESVQQAKQSVTDAYGKANKSVTEQYDKAVEYGHENLGITTMIALGLGVGIGLLLAGGVKTLRNRA